MVELEANGYGVLSVHWSDGFKGMELGLTHSVLLAAIAVSGPGRLSLDRARSDNVDQREP